MGKGRNRLGMVAVAVGAVLSGRMAYARRRRRMLFEKGQIQELVSAWVDVDGCLIHGRISRTAGAGDVLPIVLIHGLGMSGSYFTPTAERLATDFAVYVPDLPGHGRSHKPSKPLSIRDSARVLLNWMDALGLERACLIGHSMGCQIAVEAALQDPERVDRLVLIGPTPDPAARSVFRQFRRALLAGIHERPSLNVHLTRDYVRRGKALLPEFRFMLEDPLEEKLPKITVPTLLVRGENDAIAPQSWVEEAARLLRAERIAVIPGSGHAVQYSAPSELVDSIAPFLRQPAVMRLHV